MSAKAITEPFASQADLPEMLRKGLSDDKIRASLHDRYQDEFLVEKLMAEVKKLRNSAKTTSGLIFVFIGAVLLLLSCILTLTGSYSSGTFGPFLFGLTSIGLIIVFIGLVKIFN